MNTSKRTEMALELIKTQWDAEMSHDEMVVLTERALAQIDLLIHMESTTPEMEFEQAE